MARIGDVARIVRRLDEPPILLAFPMDPNRRLRVCLAKRRYESLGEAEAAARQLRRKGHGDDVEDYFCELCGGWHVGHRSKLEDGGRTARRRVAS